MEKRDLQRGEIMQINPDRSGGLEWFGACLLVVTEPHEWGAQGYVKNAGMSGLAFIRVRFEDMEPTGGRVVWLRATADDLIRVNDPGPGVIVR